jgi:hypothetical protein
MDSAKEKKAIKPTYIELINCFWMTTVEGRTSHEAHLYFKLLDICNKLNWKNPFDYKDQILYGELNISDKTFKEARQGLEAKGLIRYRKGHKGMSSKYMLINRKISDQKQDWSEDWSEDSPEKFRSTIDKDKDIKAKAQADFKKSVHVNPLKKIREFISETESFKLLHPISNEKLEKLLKEFPLDVVMDAIFKADDSDHGFDSQKGVLEHYCKSIFEPM